MIGPRELNLEDYQAILRRRWWIILVPAILGPAIAYGISLVLPTLYTSKTLVLIEQQRVPDSFVQPVITNDLNARIANMEEQILSRTRLQPIIERYNLFPKDAKNQPMEVLVDKLRKDISITPITPIVRSREEVLPGFYINLTLESARLAQQVCADITSMFVDENLRQREQSAQGTTNFLDSQLADAKRRLDEQDAKLADFKRKFTGELPDETQANLNLLASLNTQLQAATQNLNRAQQDRAYSGSLLTQQLASWNAWKAVESGPQPATAEQELAQREKDLRTLESAYTPDHPDVVRLKTAIDDLKKRTREAGASDKNQAADKAEKPSVSEPRELQQLRSQVLSYDQAIKSATQEQDRLQQQIKSYQARLQMTPVVEQQYKEMTRSYTTAVDFYNELLKKKNQSAMATDLEHRQQGEQFRIMDPANMPEKPSFPNRPVFAGAGFGGGLVLGLALAYLLEMRDKSLRTERDIEFYLGVPMLAAVPVLANGNRKKHNPRERARKGEALSLNRPQA